MSEYVSSFSDDVKLVKEMQKYSQHLNVLLVEDNPTNRVLYEMWLRKFFASYEMAEDGREGLEKMRAKHFDIVITDIMMPVMNGIEMIQASRRRNREQLFVVLSSDCSSETLLELIELGVDRFIPKENEMYFFLFTLQKVCKDIYMDKKIKTLQNEVIHLENQKLATLDLLGSYETVSDAHKDMLKKSYTKQSAVDYVRELGTDASVQSERLETLEEDANLLVERFVNDPQANKKDFNYLFDSYAQSMSRLYEFENLAYATASVARSLENFEKWRDQKDLVKDLLFAVVSNLVRWREELLVTQTLDDIHYYDVSLISDCVQIESFFADKNINSSMEFFN
jgi:CheY-like chemotaxis protein